MHVYTADGTAAAVLTVPPPTPLTEQGWFLGAVGAGAGSLVLCLCGGVAWWLCGRLEEEFIPGAERHPAPRVGKAAAASAQQIVPLGFDDVEAGGVAASADANEDPRETRRRETEASLLRAEQEGAAAAATERQRIWDSLAEQRRAAEEAARLEALRVRPQHRTSTSLAAAFLGAVLFLVC